MFGVYNLYRSQPLWGTEDTLASLLSSCHVVHLYIQTMIEPCYLIEQKLPFQRQSGGSWLQRSHIVGFWSEKSRNNRKHIRPHSVQLCSDTCWVLFITCPLQNALISSVLQVWSSFSLMQAHTCSPSLSSFTPTTSETQNHMLNFHHSRLMWLLCGLNVNCLQILCCPPLVVTLTCTSCTFGCV